MIAPVSKAFRATINMVVPHIVVQPYALVREHWTARLPSIRCF